MAWSRAQTAQYLISLEHPDGVRQRELMDGLLQELATSETGESLDAVIAHINLVEPGVRVPLIRVLSEFAHPDALLPLMRFVFDSRSKVHESDARGLAMQAIMRIATPEHAGKLFNFLMDMKHDEDTFVRGYTAEAIAKFGDARARPILEGMLQADSEEFVKERARRALRTLDDKAQGAGDGLAQHDLSDQELLQQIRGNKGKDREYWMGILRERPHHFELLSELITQGGSKGTLIALRELLDTDEPRARQLVARHLTATQDTAERAISLRILAKHLKGDATADELKLLQQARHDNDMFVQRAALTAFAASGNADMIQQALNVLNGRDEIAAQDVATALPNSGGAALKKHTSRIREALSKFSRARQQSASDALELTEANLLQALAAVAPELNVGRRDLQRDALASLHEAHTRWPIVVSALKLLRETTGQEDALPEQARWKPSESAPLLDLLNHDNPRVQKRAMELLRYGAPLKWSMMTGHLESFLNDDDAPLVSHIIPLLELAGDSRAEQLLEDLSLSHDADVKDAARQTLQRMRNGQRVVEASFFKPGDEF